MIKVKYIFLFALAIFLLASCGSQRQAINLKNTDGEEISSDGTSNTPRRSGKFTETEIFHNAINAKTLGENEKAIELFKEVIKNNNKNHAAYYEISKLLLKEKKVAEAGNYVSQAVALDSDNIWYQKTLAEVYNYQGKNEEAIKIYDKLLDKYPNEPEFYFDLAFIYERSKQYGKAIATFDRLTDLIGIEENISLMKEKLYLKMNDIEGAAGELRKLIAAYPDDSRFYGMLAELYEVQGESQKALEVYDELIKKDPDNPYAALALANHYRNKGDLQKYRENIRKAYGNPQLNIDLKVGYLLDFVNAIGQNEEKREEAFELAELMVQAHPDDPKAYALYGDILYAADQPEKALEQYNKSLTKNDGVFTVWQQVMVINSELQQFEKLKEVSQEAMELFPNQAIAYFFNGIAKNQLKNHQSAIKVLDQALLIGSSNKALTAEIYANLGEAYHALKEYKEADDSYEKSLALNPNNAFVLNNYSYYLSLRNEKLNRAAEMSKKANELMPENSAFQDTYGWVLYKQGKYAEAKEMISKALKNNGNSSAVILEHYGDVLFKLGNVDEAVSYWEKALSKAGNDKNDLQKKITDRQLYE